MEFVEPKVEVIEQGPGLDGVFSQIEVAGRTCYKSEDKITKDSAERFVKRMIESGHYGMLEHGTVYLYLEVNHENAFKKFDYPLCGFTARYNFKDVVGNIAARYRGNKYSREVSRVETSKKGEYDVVVEKYYITTNYRVIIENGWQDDLQFICEPTKYHERRVTFKFNTQVAITREINRHRVNSMAEQSTRSCNYSKDKFGNQISISIPHFTDRTEIDGKLNGGTWTKTLCGIHEDYLNDFKTVRFAPLEYWLAANEFCEWIYMRLLDLGMKPEDARTVLPFDLNSELVHTAFVSDWQHFIGLRAEETKGNKPHKDVMPLAKSLREYLTQTCLL